ncbi:MAG: hypothetical protein DCF19_19625 [Pseudanabaena frigida]|uniref:Uncharacterized protein n=1 Tax=Pseudanabaena frigida TaxID=945775 RepID=A0A2W4VYY5_9CYAN|nr:MAG: hypothetical protein DCF19_19625 [Pseudanabaena frigida]
MRRVAPQLSFGFWVCPNITGYGYTFPRTSCELVLQDLRDFLKFCRSREFGTLNARISDISNFSFVNAESIRCHSCRSESGDV